MPDYPVMTTRVTKKCPVSIDSPKFYLMKGPATPSFK